MLSCRLFAGAFLASGVLGGCASTQFQADPGSVPVVPINEVIGSMKCGLARAIKADSAHRAGLLNGVAKVTLKVNIVEGTALKGGLSAGIPIATGASATPSFSVSNDRTRTTNSEINFSINMSSADLRVCKAQYAVGRDAGFTGWIGQVVQSLNETVAGAPLVSVQSYEYDSDFVIKQTAGVGIEFEIVPVKGNASYDSSRSDIQHLNVKIGAVHGPGGMKPGAKPFGKDKTKL